MTQCPDTSHAEGLPNGVGGWWACGELVSLSSTQGMAERVGFFFFFCSQAWQTEQLRWLGRGRGEKKNEGNEKNQWLKYSVTRGGWVG